MTKLLPLFAAALFATAGMASASNTFGLNEVQSSDNLVEFGTVVANGDGVVEVYEYHGAQQGRLLGYDAVHAGANTDVKISVGPTAASNFLAVLKINGDVVAQQVVRTSDAR
jgi:hypothetical protein